VALETIAGVAAGVLLSRHRDMAAAVLLCVLTAAAAQAQTVPADRIATDRIETLPALIDATVPKLLEQQHIAGTAVAVVHDGRVVLLRGYGRARLNPDVPVDPERTLFRVGSITKTFTGVAALHLVDDGRLDLHQDIRAYVPEVPMRYGATTHQLLTHTAGFGERFAGGYTDAAHLVPLAEHLRLNPPAQDIRPGRAYSYSNYNTALAGRVVEARSGTTFERYMADHVFAPLRMTHSTVQQPPPPQLAESLARGYRWIGGRLEPLDYRYTNTGPSGALATTAADMGRFMLAMLGDGSLDGRRVLSADSVRAIGAPQYTPDPRIPATGYGLVHLAWHGHEFLYKDGTLDDQHGSLLLMPDDGLGIFVASNSIPGLGDFLYAPMMTHLYGTADPPLAPVTSRPDARDRAARFAGSYRDFHHTRNDMSRIRALMPMIQSRVSVAADGALEWHGHRWLEVEPSVFRREDAEDYLVFRSGEDGSVVDMHTASGSYERIGWQEQTAFHGVLLVACVAAFVAYAGFRLVSLLRRRPSTPDGRMAGRLAAFVATTNLLFLTALAPSLRELGAVTPLPWPQMLIMSLPLVSLVATALLPGFAARAWIAGWWTRRERLGYSAVAVLSVTFMTFLNYWKLLGIRY
jgi:CubicO group peptidase (beta-lactamase class C family)